MPLQVTKQPKENSQNALRRFSKKLRESGILLEARKRRFQQRPKSTQAKKFSALRRVSKKAEYIELKKAGKIIPYSGRNTRR